LLQNGIVALQAALVACCLYLVYSIGAALFGGDPVPEPKIRPPVAAAAIERPAADYSVVARRNLFQTLAVVPVAFEAPEPDIEESRLRFTLLGTATTLPTEHSIAVLEDATRERLHLHVGDELSPGVTLQSIERERVIVSNRGRLEEIRLPEKPDRPRPAVSKARRAVSPRPQARARPRSTLSDRLRRIAQNAENVRTPGPRARGILDQARMLPTYDPSGGFEGLKVNFVEEGSAVEGMGLQVGDLITSVNRQVLENPADGLRALRGVKPGDTLIVELDRNGAATTLEYVLEE
jgi:type II secretion system protein C